jgi:hypothetical protein
MNNYSTFVVSEAYGLPVRNINQSGIHWLYMDENNCLKKNNQTAHITLILT